ncbi:MAG: archease [Candidatus Asgardarchaeia archaeon]
MIRNKDAGFRYLEHTADVYIEAWAPTLEKLFEQCALAMYDIMTDVKDFEYKEKRRIVVDGEELYLLLYNWLEELLIIFDTEYLIFPKIEVEKIQRQGEKYILKANCEGDIFNPSKHVSKVEVKAVTLHMMEIKKEDNRYIARVVFDI